MSLIFQKRQYRATCCVASDHVVSKYCAMKNLFTCDADLTLFIRLPLIVLK